MRTAYYHWRLRVWERRLRLAHMGQKHGYRNAYGQQGVRIRDAEYKIEYFTALLAPKLPVAKAVVE